MSISAFIKRHPVMTYYVLVFAISWGGMLLVVGPGGIPGTPKQIEMLFPIALMVLLAGPSVSGLLLTGLVSGRAGLRELLSRLLQWRVGARWYAVALLATPLLVTAVLLALSLLSSDFLPSILTTGDKATLLLSGIAVGLMGGFLEELGWTGFAIARLRLRYGVLTTGLLVGVLWGVWHFLITFWMSSSPSGALSLALFLPSLISAYGVLPTYRVLMVWLYDRTGSLLLAMLMHASLIASILFILVPMATALLTYYFVLTAVLWVVVVAMAKGGWLSRQPLGR